MGIHLEPVTAVLRCGNDSYRYGDPYEFSATVVIRGRKAELVGGSGTFDPRWRKRLLDELFAWGVTELWYERKSSTRGCDRASKAVVMDTRTAHIVAVVESGALVDADADDDALDVVA